MTNDVIDRLREASELLDKARIEIEDAEVAMYQETGEFPKTTQSVLADIWGVRCKVNILQQDWSLR